MDIEIIQYPKEYLDILYLAGRNCYGLECLDESMTYENKKAFVQRLIKNQHESVLEHININLYCKDMSRSFMAQITRHRLVSYSIKSQHFCKHENFKFKMLESDIMTNEYLDLMKKINEYYMAAIKNGMPKYIAREVLPNSTYTNIFMTTNVRQWRNIIKQRSTLNNTPEIILWSKTILDLFIKSMPELFEDLKC
jgi:thymidylate synthase (FAD)